MTTMGKVSDRYDNDVVFARYVDMMRHCIKELHLTPSEMREAAMLACIIEEERRPPEAVRLMIDSKLEEVLAWLKSNP
jgi:hypothetical protein